MYTYEIEPPDETDDLFVFVVRQHLYRSESDSDRQGP